MSKRQRILDAIRTRLEGIQRSAGYQTNAGDRVFLGEVRVLSDDDPSAAVAMVPDDDDLTHHGVNVALEWPVEIQVVAKADVEAPHETIEALIADVKQAMETSDRNLTVNGSPLLSGTGMRRGRTRMLPRQDGAETVGASILYLLPFTDAWGGA